MHGIAGEIVGAIGPQSEADPASLLLQFLAAFGNICGRERYMQIEGDRHPPQIWPVLVGETAKARKGTSWGRIRQLFDLAAPDWAADRVLAAGLSSGEGVIWHVRDRIVRQVKNKKTGNYEQEETDPGIADKRLFLIEPEFASPLRHIERTGNTLSAILRCLWDRGDVAPLTKNSPARTTGSLVSIVAHVTVEELRRYLTRSEISNGLGNRFLFACVRRSKKLPFGGGGIEGLDLLAKRLGGLVSGSGEEVCWTNEARALWEDNYDELSEGKPGLAGAITSRAEAQTLRLALIYALLDGLTVLRIEHLQAALAVWKYCDQSASYLFGTSLGSPVADQIRTALAAAPRGMTRTEISALGGRHWPAETIDQALALLLERGMAHSDTRSTRGRTETRWFVQ